MKQLHMAAYEYVAECLDGSTFKCEFISLIEVGRVKTLSGSSTGSKGDHLLLTLCKAFFSS